MIRTRFDNIDRKRVIVAAEQHFNVDLKKVGRRQKWLRDKSGRNWWVLGGYGDWHGIPEEMMDAELSARSEGSEGILVVAMRKPASMEAFAGPVGQLLRARDKLNRASESTGDYQFTYTVGKDRIFIDQAPGVSLAKFASIPYEDEDKEKDRRSGELEKLIEKMSEMEKTEILKALHEKKS